MSEYYEAETEQELYDGLQSRINDGSIWRLEGSAGRSAMNAIQDGFCMLGRTAHRDYWGNVVPSRTDVKSGTKGSRRYVADLHGEAYARKMATIPSVQLRGAA